MTGMKIKIIEIPFCVKADCRAPSFASFSLYPAAVSRMPISHAERPEDIFLANVDMPETTPGR